MCLTSSEVKSMSMFASKSFAAVLASAVADGRPHKALSDRSGGEAGTPALSHSGGRGRLRAFDRVRQGGEIRVKALYSLHLINWKTRLCAHGRARLSWTLQLLGAKVLNQPMPHEAKPTLRQASAKAEFREKTSMTREDTAVVNGVGTEAAEAKD